jgi:hypothetical protein
VKLKAITNVSGNISANFTKNVTVNYPNYYPRILSAYTIGGFETNTSFRDFMNDSGNVKAVLLPIFDLMPWQENYQANQTRIDEIHSRGLLVYAGIAIWQGVGGWNNWTNIQIRIPRAVLAGVDGIEIDEYYVLGTQHNDLMNDLRAINPNVRSIITHVGISSINASLVAGARPDYIAAEWYLNPGGYQPLKDLAQQYGIRSAYWVDYTTYSKTEQTYNEMDMVLLWNLCWNGGTCGGKYPYWSWLPWNVTKPYVENLGPGLE